MDRDENRGINTYFKIGLWSIILLIILWFNYDYISTHMSSNNSYINSFQLQEEVVEKYKEPAVSGIFYSANPQALAEDIGRYLQSGRESNKRKPKMLIVPHAGYKYSAQVAGQAYFELQKYSSDIKNVVIVGPAHYIKIQGAALPKYSHFKTPLGNIALNTQHISNLSNNPLFSYNNKAFSKEHSIEVQLPFLQKTLKNFQIIPILYGQIDANKLAQGLEHFLYLPDTILIFSADLSHYYQSDQAEEIDTHTARMIDLGNAGLNKEMSCGAEGINAALILAQKMQMNAQLIDITHSGKVTGNLDSVVGYGAWTFSENQEAEKDKTQLEQEVDNLKTFANIYGQDLLKIAEQSLQSSVHKKKLNISRQDYPDILFDKGASFITLTQKGKLRGCIGSLLPRNAIIEDVSQNTYKASQEDSRFSPITAQEINDLSLSISFLTSFQPIHFANEDELLQQIIQGTDGLVLRDGDRQGLFLPSVWNEIKNKKEFLDKLKLKAGMAPGYWSKNIKAFKFRTVEIKRDEN